MVKRRLTVSKRTQQGAGRWAEYGTVASMRLEGLGFETRDRFVEEYPVSVILTADPASEEVR